MDASGGQIGGGAGACAGLPVRNDDDDDDDHNGRAHHHHHYYYHHHDNDNDNNDHHDTGTHHDARLIVGEPNGAVRPSRPRRAQPQNPTMRMALCPRC